METKFQTSFIPKTPTLPPVGMHAQVSHAGEGFASIYLMVASLLLVVSLAGVGGAYWYKNTLEATQASQIQQLKDSQAKFDNANGGPKLEEVKALNAKITAAETLLANHLALSGVFESISRLTIESVRFMSLDLSAPKLPGDPVKISMQGYGINLFSVAFQSDVLNALSKYGLTDVVKSPVLTDPAIDAKGKVSFGFSASIDPSGPTSLYYKDKVLNAAAAASAGAIPASPAPSAPADQTDQSSGSQTPSTPFGR